MRDATMHRQPQRCDPNRLRLLLEEELQEKQQAELESHLSDCRVCQQALERLAADKRWWDDLRQIDSAELGSSARIATNRAQPRTEDVPTIPAAPSDTLEPGLNFLEAADDPAHIGTLGPFAVTEVIGRGGMGIVFKATDTALNRPVAIKVLSPHLAGSGAARKRFERESQAAAAVVHEHVVPIHSVDTWKGLPYLVMSFIAGRSLQERIDREGPLPVEAILRIGMQAASGLAAAHAQGLVHRDVKPANILLENGIERVRLTDFGLARAVDDASLTQSGVVAGTPQYMAPEQARGESIDFRADLFSLGSTLYAMAAGHAPFRAESALAVLRRVCDEEPRPLRSINPAVPVWLAAIIEKLHAKDPADRFQAAGEVADLLGGCLAHVHQPDAVPLPAMAFAPTGKTKRSRRRRRWVVSLAASLALLAGGLVLWTPVGQYFFPASNHTSSKDDADSAQAQATNARIEADTLKIGVGEVRRRTAALEADLLQTDVPGLGDPMNALLIEMQRRLDALQRELSKSVLK